MKNNYLGVVALAVVMALGVGTWTRSARVAGAKHDSSVADAAERASRPARREAPSPLPRVENAAVDKYLKKYTEGAGLKATLIGFERAQSMRADAEKIFMEEGVPADLVWLAQVESLWRARAVSPAAAAGVWQFIPKTAERFGLRADAERDDRQDFKKQTRVAARYLRFLHDYYDGNWALAIGAYNTGEENMDRAIARAGGVKDFWVLREKKLLHPETMEYVPKVLAASIVGSNPGRFGLERQAPPSYADRQAD